MADKKPIKAKYTGPDPVALGEFEPGDAIGIIDGGTSATTVSGARFNLGIDQVQNIKNNYQGIIAPTINNDSLQGYSTGSGWVDEVVDKAYKCVDPSVGSAVWKDITTTSSGGGSGLVDSVFGRTGAVVAVTNDYTWNQIDKTLSDLNDITAKSHTSLTDKGSNTHVQIDTHLTTTSGNPHNVLATEITDFDTEVSNNSSVIANTSKVSAGGSVTTHTDVTISGGEFFIIDSTRGNKQLSSYIVNETQGRNSSNTTNQYLRMVNGVPSNISGFVLPFNTTLVGISMAGRDNNETWTVEVRKNGLVTILSSLQIVNSYSNQDFTVNVDFNSGDRVQLYLNGSSISYPTATVFFKRRI